MPAVLFLPSILRHSDVDSGVIIESSLLHLVHDDGIPMGFGRCGSDAGRSGLLLAELEGFFLARSRIRNPSLGLVYVYQSEQLKHADLLAFRSRYVVSLASCIQDLLHDSGDSSYCEYLGSFPIVLVSHVRVLCSARTQSGAFHDSDWGEFSPLWTER